MYLKQMKTFHELRASKRHERDIYVRWNEMHTYMRELNRRKKKNLNNVKKLSKMGARIEHTGGTIGEA
jgi:uridine kinase